MNHALVSIGLLMLCLGFIAGVLLAYPYGWQRGWRAAVAFWRGRKANTGGQGVGRGA